MHSPYYPRSWDQVISHLRSQPVGTLVRFRPHEIQHPRDGGLQPSLAFPIGQRISFQRDIDQIHRLVVNDFVSYLEAKLEVRPSLPDFESILCETPGTTVSAATAIGALTGLAIGQSKEAALVGALVGALASLLGVAVANAADAPPVSEAASNLAQSITNPIIGRVVGRNR